MDLCNTGGRLGGACTAAIFLKRFVDGLIVDGKDAENQEGLIRWAHLDIAGTYCRSNLIKVIPQRS
jgi:aminopeptidase